MKTKEIKKNEKKEGLNLLNNVYNKMYYLNKINDYKFNHILNDLEALAIEKRYKLKLSKNKQKFIFYE